jgi:hypothetical protein
MFSEGKKKKKKRKKGTCHHDRWKVEKLEDGRRPRNHLRLHVQTGVSFSFKGKRDLCY